MMYRVTRPEAYSVNTPGFNDPSARQGHYIKADSKELALAEMSKRFPNEKNFDVQEWE